MLIMQWTFIISLEVMCILSVLYDCEGQIWANKDCAKEWLDQIVWMNLLRRIPTIGMFSTETDYIDIQTKNIKKTHWKYSPVKYTFRHHCAWKQRLPYWKKIIPQKWQTFCIIGDEIRCMWPSTNKSLQMVRWELNIGLAYPKHFLVT